MRHFNENMCDTIPWLCECHRLWKLFCWPCLLFSQEKSAWYHTGFDDLNNLHKSQKRHQVIQNNIMCLNNLHSLENKDRIVFKWTIPASNRETQWGRKKKQKNTFSDDKGTGSMFFGKARACISGPRRVRKFFEQRELCWTVEGIWRFWCRVISSFVEFDGFFRGCPVTYRMTLFSLFRNWQKKSRRKFLALPLLELLRTKLLIMQQNNNYWYLLYWVMWQNLEILRRGFCISEMLVTIGSKFSSTSCI